MIATLNDITEVQKKYDEAVLKWEMSRVIQDNGLMEKVKLTGSKTTVRQKFLVSGEKGLNGERMQFLVKFSDPKGI